MPKRKARAPQPIGWREWILLPELCSLPLKAKIDTGARTSSLHAFDLTIDDDVARFEIHPSQRAAHPVVAVTHPIAGFRKVRSSTGHTEVRPVIRTPVAIGEHEYDIDITLTSRDSMGFRMLLGRSALRRRFTVDAGRSFLQGDRP